MPASPGAAPRLTRRRLLLGAVGAVAGTVGYATLVEPHWLSVVEREIAIRGLPKDLAGKTLLHMSDLHAGARVDPAYLERSLERAASLRPDLVVVTGDLTDGGQAIHQEFIAEGLLRLARAVPLGVVAILGNHDYGRNWSQVEEADRLVGMLRARGITLLRNEVVTVAGLQVGGLDDYWADRLDPTPLHEALDPARAAIVLCHNPDVCDLNVWRDFQGWILSGHTHGGQCKPPFLPPPLLPVENRRYTQGEFDVGGGRRCYISPGVGYLVRARFLVRPEIALFRLTAECP